MALPTGNIDATDPATILSFDGSGFDATRVISPTVVWDGSRYVMLFAGLPFGNNFQIGLATSADGTTWTPHSSDPVISNAASQPWGSFREIPASAVYENGTYKLWFYGDNSNLSSDPGFGSGFGLATSTDAVNWTWHPANPIRWEPNTPPGNGFNLTEVVKLGGQYHAYFADQDPAGDIFKHAVSADGITFSGDAQLTLPAGYQLRAATTATDGSTEYVLAVFESGGVQHYGTSLDGVNFTIQGSTDLPLTFGTSEVLVRDGQATFFGTASAGNVNWPFGNAVIQSATAELTVNIEQNPLVAAAELSNDAYSFEASTRLQERGWAPVQAADLDITTAPTGWSFTNGVFLSLVPLVGGLAVTQGAHLYTGLLNNERTLAVAFRGTDEGAVEILREGLGGFEKFYNSFTEFLDKTVTLATTGGFDRILVTGHSLGGALAQMFIARELQALDPTSPLKLGVTFGSPGAAPSDVVSSIPLINVVHDDDTVIVQPRGERFGTDLVVESPLSSRPPIFSVARGNIPPEHEMAEYNRTAHAIVDGLQEIGRGAELRDLLDLAPNYTLSLNGATRFDSFNQAWERRPDIILGTTIANQINGEGSALEANDDILFGAGGNDTLNGGRSNDTLIGGPDRDTIDGGLGSLDTALFRGSFVDFQLSRSGILLRDWRVTDANLADGNEGIDTVRANVEFMRFDDGILMRELETLLFYQRYCLLLAKPILLCRGFSLMRNLIGSTAPDVSVEPKRKYP